MEGQLQSAREASNNRGTQQDQKRGAWVLPQGTGQLFLSKDMNQLPDPEGSGLDSINDLIEEYRSQKCEALD